VAESQGWPRVAVVGAGAVGGYFGGVMARAGASVVMIGRPAFVEAITAKGLFLDTTQFQETVRVEASTELSAVRGAEIVLFCVKTTDSDHTARELVPLLAPNAVVVSLQNGVDNAERIRAASGLDAVGAVVYVAAAVKAPGHIRHFGRGDLVIGPETEPTKRLAAQFARCAVPCRVSNNIEGELWVKFIANCALNPVSAIGQAKYGRIADSPDAVKLLEMVGDEVLAVARAAGIELPGVQDRAAALAVSMNIATQMTEQFSSTGQDLNRGKRTEIDSLNGHIVRRGIELNIPTPANHALYTLVKLDWKAKNEHTPNRRTHPHQRQPFDPRAFRADSRRRGGFAAGRPPLPSAGSLLGFDFDAHRDAIDARCVAPDFRAAPGGHCNGWDRRWRRSRLFSGECAGLRYRSISARNPLRRVSSGTKRLPLRQCGRGHHHARSTREQSLDHRRAPLC